MFDAEFNIGDLDGSNGFTITGNNAFDNLGASVSNAGDVNGDGIDDVIIGAPGVEVNGVDNAGQSYVLFGTETIVAGGSFNISDIEDATGLIINGVQGGAGASVSAAGDINNDGIDDLIIGAPSFDDDDTTSRRPGASYVVFGNTNLDEDGLIELDLSSLNGENGFVINERLGTRSGSSVSGVGDVNGDTFDDLVISNFGAPSYLVFGGETLENNINNGSLNLSDLDNESGLVFLRTAASSGAGDVNNDGINDVIFGSLGSNESYILFGDENLGGRLISSDLNGENGFVISGADRLDDFGASVSNLGDVNGDSIDDFIVSAPRANGVGASYVIFGSSNIGTDGPSTVSELDGSNGFVIEGLATNGSLGSSVSGAGDINGDGINDLIIGDRLFGTIDQSRPVVNDYVVFGGAGLGSNGSLDLSTLDGNNGFAIAVTRFAGLGTSVSGAGDFNNDGVDDLIISDPRVFNSSGQSYIIFGSALAVPDTNNIEEDAFDNQVTGNVLDNDNDSDGNGLTVAAVNDSPADVGQTIQGQYGSLVLNGNGTYTYTLDNANPTVDSLNTGETLTDTFNYRVSDGSTEATTTLAITINGVTDGSSATFTVTEGLDDGTGNTAGTLSWAIQQANTQAGADVVELASDVRLNFADERIRMDPLIDSDITIEGNGFTISGDNNNNGQVDIGNTDTNGDGFTNDRDADRPVFFVESGNVTIRDLTITGAVAWGEDGSGGGAGMGGGLFVSDGNVTIDNVTFDNNRAVGGDAAGGSPFGGGLGLRDRTGAAGRDGLVSPGGALSNGTDGDTGLFGGGGGRGGNGGGGKIDDDGGNGGDGGDGGFGSGGGRGGLGGDGKSQGGYAGRGGTGGFGGGGGPQGIDGTGKSGRGTVTPDFPPSGGAGGFGGGDGNNSDSSSYGGGGAGLGGAVFIRSGTLSIFNSSFNNNAAQGGLGSNFESSVDDGSGFGGAIFAITDEALQNHTGSDQGLPTALPTVTISNTQFSNNTADGVEDNVFGSAPAEADQVSTQSAASLTEADVVPLATDDRQDSPQVANAAENLTDGENTLPDNGASFKDIPLNAVVGLQLTEAEQTLIETAFDVPETVDLTNFDPLEAAAADDPAGVDVLAKLVTAQTTVVQTGALLQGAVPEASRSALETASSAALLEMVQTQADAGQTVDLADSTQVQSILETTVAMLQSMDDTLNLQSVSDAIPQLTQVISASNQAAFDAATNNPIPEAVNGLFQVQAVAQETVAADLQAAVAGEQSLDDVVTNNTGDALAEQIAAAEANVDPVAVEDAFTTTTGATLNGNVLADNGSGADTDFDGDMLSISAVNGEAPAVGQSLTLDSGASLTVNQDGTFTYIPANNFAGPDTFTYEVSDGNGGSDSAIATIIVQQTDIPAIIDLAPLFLIRNEGDSGTTTYSYTVTRRNVLDTTTLVNFELRDVVGLDTVDAADFVGNVLPSGTLTFNPGETIQTINIDVVGDTDIEPDELFRVRLSAPDGTTLQFGDGVIDVDDGTFEGVIQDDDDPQRPPRIAVDDSLRTDEDTPLNLPVQSLLANDTDGDTLSLISVDGTNTLGTVTLDGTTVVYDPNGQFESVQDLNSRTDRFTYTVSDSNGNTSTATVTVVVTGVNDPPMANPDTNSITEDAEPNTVSGDVLLNDADGDNPGAARQRLTVTAVNDDATAVGETITGQYGSLTLAADGDYTYTLDNSNPTVNALNNSETLVDSFSYRMSDGDLEDMTTLDITINGVTDGNGNQPPDAVNDDFSTDEDVPLSDNVVTNDIDPDSEVLLVSLLTDVSNGSLMLNETGSFTYTPNADFNGTDSFTYEVNDGELTDTAVATVTVNPSTTTLSLLMIVPLLQKIHPLPSLSSTMTAM